MPLISTRGAASAQGFGEFASSAAPVYIEDVFGTYLYTGNGSTQTITNGIDLSTKGGLVWLKGRSGATDHALYDTARGSTKDLVSNSTAAQTTESTGLTAFTASGFSLGALAKLNTNAATYASWTFRKQAKFFDVVTYTGNGSTTQTISHNLGSVPGCIIAKGTSGATDWPVYHRNLNSGTTPEQWYLRLNATAAQTNAVANWGNIAPTSTQFTVGGNNNVNGYTYVAYLFAHDAGGFGLAGTDNVISCGSYTGNGSSTGPTITLGYEPQWVMVKRTTVSTGSWEMFDSMRGFTMGADAVLRADTSGAEFSLQRINPTSTGFQLADSDGDVNANGSDYIYIAIRRGPMKTPTSGTSVFSPVARTGANSGSRQITGVGFAPDVVFNRGRTSASDSGTVVDRLRGGGSTVGTTPVLRTALTNAEGTIGGLDFSGNMDGFLLFDDGQANWSNSAYSYINHCFKRAPGFFDVVCYTGTGASTELVYHNLGAYPELVVIKRRDSTSDWMVNTLSNGSIVYSLGLNSTSADNAASFQGTAYSAPTYIGVRTGTTLANISGATYVAYLFATVAGVSKVGSYTGTGTTLQIDCGFTGGARFVLIKRTDSTGDWYVYDSARGIVSGNDPYLFLNSTAAEVTNTDYVDTYSAGFELSSTAPAALNANGGTFIFFAVA
jgi:hypothetical protein